MSAVFLVPCTRVLFGCSGTETTQNPLPWVGKPGARSLGNTST